MSLKQAADNLGINYSTAKTIVQTFRREKRIAKRPKYSLETKKAVKHEKFMIRFLNQQKVDQLVSEILVEELEEKPIGKRSQEFQHAVSEATSVTQAGQPGKQEISRVESATQFALIETDEEGPKEGQHNKGVTINVRGGILKKDVFYIHYDSENDEIYKNKIDFSNMIFLRSKPRIESNFSFPVTQPKVIFPFNFAEYGVKIMESVYRKSIKAEFRVWHSNRTLPYPRFIKECGIIM